MVLVDISGSMTSYLTMLKWYLRNIWLPWRINHPPGSEIALISFCNDVCINSHYTTNLPTLQTEIGGLVPSGCGGPMTSLYDAILVGLVFEDPKPDALYVWSDLHDTKSDSSVENWKRKAKELDIPVYLCPPRPWMLLSKELAKVQHRFIHPSAKLIPFEKAVDMAKEIKGKVEQIKVIEDLEKLLESK